MKNKGFVLMETIVVIVVISVSLLTIFSSYNKILRKVKTENKYDTSEYIYMTEYVKKYLSSYSCEKKIYEMGKINDGDEDFGIGKTSRVKELKNHFDTSCGFSNDEVNNYTHPFGIKGIYLVKYLTEVDEDADKPDLEKFDAYMIDYIRKLDVGVNDELIIVEYERNAVNNKGEKIYTTKCPKDSNDESGNPCKPLTETYIASLEW